MSRDYAWFLTIKMMQLILWVNLKILNLIILIFQIKFPITYF